jgi:hypothetical protein
LLGRRSRGVLKQVTTKEPARPIPEIIGSQFLTTKVNNGSLNQ